MANKQRRSMYHLFQNRSHVTRHFSSAIIALAMLAPVVSVRADDDGRTPDLSICPSLAVPEGNAVAFHAYAMGVQIYQWNATRATWVFIAPSATLFADPGYHGKVGTHYAGPTWESNSGSLVRGVRQAACAPDLNSIPWLRLGAVFSQGPGVFDTVSYVQRVKTVGGLAPTTPGTVNGQIAEVPYTAEYYFYREQN